MKRSWIRNLTEDSDTISHGSAKTIKSVKMCKDIQTLAFADGFGEYFVGIQRGSITLERAPWEGTRWEPPPCRIEWGRPEAEQEAGLCSSHAFKHHSPSARPLFLLRMLRATCNQHRCSGATWLVTLQSLHLDALKVVHDIQQWNEVGTTEPVKET